MTRIIAGAAKGRRLAVPAEGTRPTSDRTREALFNSLTGLIDLDGARVLDLYAGTGAVGLEALSRGAADAVLVESNAKAAQVLRRNVATVGLPGAGVVARPVSAFLSDPPVAPFDLVFADPPYDLGGDVLDDVLARLDTAAWLAADAVVVVERAARTAGPAHSSDHLTFERERRYGDSVLWYGRRR